MYLCTNTTGNHYCDYTVTDKPRQCNYEERSGGSFHDCQYCKQIEDLKPCPFCGGKAELRDEVEKWGTMWISCTECGAESGFVDIHDGSTEQDAVNKWNNRI